MGGGGIRFARDGVTLGTVGYPGEYAPQPLRVRFGSPRHDGVYPGLAFMPHGITFRDVLVTGTPGTMTPVCAAEVPDGGVPDGGSGGSAPVDGGISTGSYDVLADVTAASWEPGVFPDVGDLNVEGDGASPQAIVYLRFPALAGTVTHAVLRVHAQAIASAAGGSGEVCAVADDSWDENTLTWATRPAVGACTGATTAVDPDTDVAWDVTSLVTSGAHVNLAIVSRDPDGAHFLSKESGGVGQGPKLVVELGPAGTGGTGGAGTGGSGTGAGSGTGGSGTGAGPAGGAPAEETRGGCGCRTTGDENTALGAAALAAALGLGARVGRRRRRAATGKGRGSTP
ncbi:MAG: DNRLRE domain-containing protein [Polyangiaceae bacterium]|nr:DNRLRE domain-containing protein [Polyangiaceae bacterium]